MEPRRLKSVEYRPLPLKIVLIYVIAGGLWILFSDYVLSIVFKDTATITRLQTFKGWLFIGITSAILYVLIKQALSAILKSEQAFLESEAKFHVLAATTASAIFIYRDRFLNVNPAMKVLTGYSEEELLAMGLYDIVHPAFRDKIRQHCEALSCGECAPIRCEFKIITKSGEERWVDFTSSIISYEGKQTGLGTAFDVTERKQAEKTLLESEERYRVIAETASDAIITIDENSLVLFANPAVSKIFGYSPAELLGKEITMLMPERFRDLHLTSLTRHVITGRRDIKWDAVEQPGLHKNGHEVPLEISYGEFVKDGKHFFTGVIRDITERKIAEKEKEHNELLERFNHDLESLISERTMSLVTMTLADRVRTPAAVIGGLAKRIITRDEISEKPKENLSVIIDEADKLETTVKDFQGFLKSRTPMFNYDDINEGIKDVIAVIEKQALNKGIHLVLGLSENPLKLNIQKDLFKMAVFNILKNAIESTPESGSITIKSSRDSNSVTLSFSDTGKGIPEEDLDSIFNPFYKTKSYRYGIGLPLIKQIVSEHMGEITVESSPGKGTTFNMQFPLWWSEKIKTDKGPKKQVSQE